MKNLLIINADDFGMSKSINNAITFCMNNNLINRTTLMVNMPYCSDAIDQAVKNNYIKQVGLHITLTEGYPLTKDILNTKFCVDGKMSRDIFKKNPISKIWLDSKTRKAVNKEIKAQIEEFIRLMGDVNIHIDSHQHVHMKPSIYFILLPLIKEYKISSVRKAINLPSKGEINIFKRIYRGGYNLILSKYDGLEIKYSGGIKAFDKELQINNGLIKGKTETWIHPDFENNKLIDRFYSENIFDFKDKWKY